MCSTYRLEARDTTRGLARVGTVVSVALALGLAAPTSVSAAPPSDPPPTGRGLIISGSIVGGLGVAALVPGVVFLITGRNSREGLASAIGAILTTVGVIGVGTGVGLLAPGIIRHRRYQDWKASSTDAAAARVGRIGVAPGGLVFRF